MKNLIDKYFELLGFKKFMMIAALVFTVFAVMGIYDIVFNINKVRVEDLFIYCGGLAFFYIFIRVIQEFWIRKGASDNYFYFFTGNKKR